MRGPRILRMLLASALHRDDRRYALADLDEEFEERLERAGEGAARRWYRSQVMRSLVPALRGRVVRRDGRARRGANIQWDGRMRGMLQNFINDLRLALRSLSRAPGVLIITVISLGFGIGAVTAVFGVANSFLFRDAVGMSDPGTLVAIYTSEDDGAVFGRSSFPDYLDILAEIDGIEDAAAVDMRTLGWGDGESIKPLLAEEVTGNFFTVTGMRPVIGRGFLPEESVVGSPERVALISYGMWQDNFAGSSDVLGATLRLNGYIHTVVGVVPDGVVSRRVPLEPDLWIPLGSVSDESITKVEALRRRDRRSFVVFGRLAEGASRESVSGQLDVLADRLRAEYGDAWVDDLDQPRSFSVLGERESRLRPEARALVGGVAVFFLGAAGLILLIACANVTTLFLARAASRSREMALRVSLGASRRRLMTMMLTEGLIPGVGAGVVGLAVASWINQVMATAVASIPFGIPIRLSFGFDHRVIGVTVLLSLGASLVFGLIPALEGSRPNLVPALKGDGARGAGRGNSRLRNLLVITQCAASLVLLVGATLFVRSLTNAAEVDFGMDPDRIAVATKRLDAEGFSPEQGMQYIRDLQERLEARPDVESVHVSRTVELTFMSVNPTLAVEVEVDGYQPSEQGAEGYWRNSVTPGYLQMLGVKVLRGRALQETDVAGAPLVAVVNETFAERFWPGQRAIGQTFLASGMAPAGSRQAVTEKRMFEVVGITKDGKYLDFDDENMPYYWTSIYQDYGARVVVAAKGTLSAEAMVAVLRESIQLAAGEVQFTPPSTLARQFSYQFVHLRIAAGVLRWAGVFGLFLAVIGIYGIVSFAVTQRTKEMAIRRAIGADTAQMLSSVVRDGMRPALIGLGFGVVLAFFGARALASVLWGVSPLDPPAFLAGVAILGSAALAASLIPARRALTIDPMETLRDE